MAEWDRNNYADCELAWTNIDMPARIYQQKWAGIVREGDGKEEAIIEGRLHPTQKPVGISVNIIIDFTKADEIILDLYGGSGTTLIAAKKTGRICYMMEIDPVYCDVIRNRYEKYVSENIRK